MSSQNNKFNPNNNSTNPSNEKTSPTTTKFLELPLEGVHTEQAREKRLTFLKKIGHPCQTYQNPNLETHLAKNHVEAFIGCTPLPTGLAGPLLLKNNHHQTEQVFIPLTTINTPFFNLLNKGLNLLNNSGGFQSTINNHGLHCETICFFENTTEIETFEQFINQNLKKISSHCKQYTDIPLKNIKTFTQNNNIHCLFQFKTENTTQQTNINTTTWQACSYIQENYKHQYPNNPTNFLLYNNIIHNAFSQLKSVKQGISIVAECFIENTFLEKKLKTTQEKLINWYQKIEQASAGIPVNLTNTLNAVFLSTGQNTEYLNTSSIAQLYLKPHEKGMHFKLAIQNLMLSTNGFLSSLPTQKENLYIMGCDGTDNENRLAKIIAGICLGHEIINFSEAINKQFTLEHIAKKRKPNTITDDKNIIQYLKKHVLFNAELKLTKTPLCINKNDTLTTIIAKNTHKFLGISSWELQTETKKTPAILKSKPSDTEMLNCMYVIIGKSNPTLAKAFNSYKKHSDYLNCHQKELIIYQHIKSEYLPQIFGIANDSQHEMYLVMMESLKTTKNTDTNELAITSHENYWTNNKITQAIKCATAIQNSMTVLDEFSEFQFISKSDFLPFSNQAYEALLADYNENHSSYMKIYKKALEFLPSVDEFELETTLIHNDFNPNNIIFTHEKAMKAFDFELACKDVPQRDIIELLSYVIHSKNITMPLSQIFKIYRAELAEILGFMYTDEDWQLSLQYSLAKYIATRMNLHMLLNTNQQSYFIKNTLHNIELLYNEIGF